MGRGINQAQRIGSIVVDETNRIGQNKLLGKDSGHIFPKINRGRRAIVKVSAPFVRPGGKEGNPPGVYLVM